jgi:hypothetical protein
MIYEIRKARNIYQRQTNKHLLEFAKNHGRTLRPEIRPVLLDILNKREIGQDIVATLEEETLLIREEDIQQLMLLVQKQACSKCGTKNMPIVCSVQRIIGSFGIQWIDEETTTLCCTNCRKKEFFLASLISFLGGWWSMSGFFKTPAALLQNILFLLGNNSNQENIARYVIEHYPFYKILEQEKAANQVYYPLKSPKGFPFFNKKTP